jgi:hypothetical protein
VALNEHGYRDDPFVWRKRDGIRRAFFLGDSYVYGVGVAREHSLPILLQRRLGPGVEVWNLGEQEANTFDYRRVAERFAGADPDLVVLGFTVDNDLSLVPGHAPPGPWKELEVRLRDRIEALRRWLTDPPGARDAPVVKPACHHPWLFDYEIDPGYRELACRLEINPWLVRRAAEGGTVHEHYEALQARLASQPILLENLEALRDAVSPAPLLVVLFPSKYQVCTHPNAELAKLGFRFRDGAPVDDGLQRALAARLDRAGVPWLDVLPALRAWHDASGLEPFYTIDDHLRPEGNQVVSDAIADHLRARGF